MLEFLLCYLYYKFTNALFAERSASLTTNCKVVGSIPGNSTILKVD